MTDEQRNLLERRLVQERDRVIQRAGRHEESIANSDNDGDLTTYPLHLADEGTDTMEQEKDLLLRSREGQHLDLIDSALRKIYKQPEAYGICENCGGPIPYERLELVPWARFCLNCVQQPAPPPGE